MLADGGAPSLVAKLRELEARRVAVAGELAGLRPVPRLPAAVVENRLAEWRRLLRQSTTQGRAVLQRILEGRLTFRPCGETYEFFGATRFDKLFAGMLLPPAPGYVKADGPLGTEHIGPEDTFDADYGRLLEQFYAKRLASPAGVEPASPP
jgi:hypothetical protein